MAAPAAETMPAAEMSVVEESSAVEKSSAVEQMRPIGLGASCARGKRGWRVKPGGTTELCEAPAQQPGEGPAR